MNKTLMGATKKMSLQEKQFADLLIKGFSLEKAYTDVYGDCNPKNGVLIKKEVIKSKANQIWKKPMVQRYIIEVEKAKSDVYVKTVTKELMAHDIMPIYKKLLAKAEDMLINEDKRLMPRDVLKFTLDYGNQINTLLGLYDNEMSSTEDKLRELIHKVDISVGGKPYSPNEIDVVDVEEYYIDDEKAREEADKMLGSFSNPIDL